MQEKASSARREIRSGVPSYPQNLSGCWIGAAVWQSSKGSGLYQQDVTTGMAWAVRMNNRYFSLWWISSASWPGIWLSDWTIKSRSGLVWNNYIVENYSDKILQVSEAQFIYFHISHSLCWLWMTRHIYSIHWDWINLICHPSSSCCNSVSSHS